MSQPQWRVGDHYKIHVYVDDDPVATFLRPEDAARAVQAVNGAESAPPAPRPTDGTTAQYRRDVVAALITDMWPHRMSNRAAEEIEKLYQTWSTP